MNVFIYALKCPTTGQVRYVGKSKNPVRRFGSHLSRANKDCDHRSNWIRFLLSVGLKPKLEILDEVSETHWQQLEVAYIEFFREQGCDLVNGTLGGEDPPSWLGKKHSPETSAKQSARQLGKKRSLEMRARLSASKHGKKLRSFSIEHIANLRLSKLGEKNPNFGKKFSPEQRAKMSVAHKARNVTATNN